MGTFHQVGWRGNATGSVAEDLGRVCDVAEDLGRVCDCDCHHKRKGFGITIWEQSSEELYLYDELSLRVSRELCEK